MTLRALKLGHRAVTTRKQTPCGPLGMVAAEDFVHRLLFLRTSEAFSLFQDSSLNIHRGLTKKKNKTEMPRCPLSLTVTLLIRMVFLDSVLAPQELNKMIMPLALSRLTLGNYLKKIAVKPSCTKMFIATLFATAHCWKQPKCSTIKE